MPRAQHYIDGHWITGDGDELFKLSPVDGKPTWRGHAASAEQLDKAVTAARKALAFWSRRPLSERITHLEAFAGELHDRKDDLAAAISAETGKPNWEAASEVDSMIRKIPLSIAAHRERRSAAESEANGELSATRYRPHGAVAVFGPFNFPGHLPNGHIVPALLAGNTVVFKPSEQAPLVADLTMTAWEAADLPPGVINCVQGGRDVGSALASHPGLNGIFFTGSFAAGRSLSQITASTPGKVLALEMGGNNPLVIWSARDHNAAAYFTILSAFITAGQRCSCARRLIVPDSSEGNLILETLVAASARIRAGIPAERPEPFMGTLISDQAANQVLSSYDHLIKSGAIPLLSMQRLAASPALLSPGIVDVTAMHDRHDEEIFGPLLQVIRVRDWEAAIGEANNTAYGLCAGLLSDDRDLYSRFFDSIRAGLINWNRPTTGASSALPFGGIGNSGNHRPSGSWAADYCSYPVASLESGTLRAPAQRLPGLAE